MDLIFHSILAALISPSSIFCPLGKSDNQIKLPFPAHTCPGGQTTPGRRSLIRFIHDAFSMARGPSCVGLARLHPVLPDVRPASLAVSAFKGPRRARACRLPQKETVLSYNSFRCFNWVAVFCLETIQCPCAAGDWCLLP